ncbi:hypothetical protein KKA15_05590 [Patescibacteria group bacterium]|nr:hypothetical protein [Patescibacteria group bacterium]
MEAKKGFFAKFFGKKSVQPAGDQMQAPADTGSQEPQEDQNKEPTEQ